ncbi:MAG TPA: CoA transferase [Thermohalobaculum sp.]|nr:CoA transferase [Thermohalobaculum sp.]
MAGPLDGVRVVDLTTMVSGPLGAMILADQGADVIKVETPAGGDHSRHVATRRGGFSASFLNNNRNKRSVALDLKHADGLAALKRLIAGADVALQNFRPGVVERLDLTQEALRHRTTAEWIETIEANDVPCAPVLTRRQMIRHPQVAGTGIVAETEHPQAGRLRQARPPARFSGTPTEHRRGGPRLGGHTREVLAEAGYSVDEIEAMIASGAAATDETAQP